MRVVVLAVLSVVLAGVEQGDACTLSGEPSASVFQPASGKAAGHQPWISLWNVKGNVVVKLLPAGTAVPVDRVGRYLRPRKPLPDGARIQVLQGSTVLADATLSTEERVLPAWSGAKLVSAKREAEGLCSPAGPVVRLRLEETHVDLDDAVLLVYLAKPDRKKPHAKLARIVGLGGGGRDVSLFNGLGEKAWLPSIPKQLWIAIADGDGHVGPAIEVR
jgi:hypothetical protein